MSPADIDARAREIAAKLTPYERAFVVWAHFGEGRDACCIARTALGRAVARILAGEAVGR